MIKNQLKIALLTGILLLTSVVPASAHVIVTPHQVGIAATQDFIVNVPNEKDNPVVSVRLLIPNNVNAVVPYVVPGWTITTKTNGSGDNAAVTEIDWNGGSIPVGQAEAFVFQAQVPANQTTLAWKAYQTYSNGTVVSWDLDPASLKNLSDAQQDALADKENKGEYSTTQVINDLTGSSTNAVSPSDLANQMNWMLGMSGVALVLSIVALGMQFMRRK